MAAPFTPDPASGEVCERIDNARAQLDSASLICAARRRALDPERAGEPSSVLR